MRFNRSGSVLMVTLWILVILSLLGFGISRRSGIDLAFTQYQVDKVRSKYIAWAGLMYAVDLIRQDLTHEDFRDIDTAYACGVVLNIDHGQKPEELFGNGSLADGKFRIFFESEGRTVWGFEDETGKLNLNALTERNYEIFKYLLMELDVPEDVSEEISAATVDWIDPDDKTFHDLFGAETGYYEQWPEGYTCKNRPLESLPELLLVRGVTPEILRKLKPYITVYPRSGALKVNFNTAAVPVLSALARFMTGAKTKTGLPDARDFVRTVAEYRSGLDGDWPTEDDRPVVFNRIALNAAQRAIAAGLMPFWAQRSGFLNVHVVGQYGSRKISTGLTAVINTDTLSIVSLKIQ